MHTLKIKISDKVYDNLMWLLSKFSKDEIEIISDDKSFIETKSYLEKEYKDILNGKACFHSVEEFDQTLEDSIGKNETEI